MKTIHPTQTSDLTRQFMLAARQRELHALTVMVATGNFVILAGQLIHALQKERGYSNMFLRSQDATTQQTLDTLSEAALQKQASLCEMLAQQIASPTAAWSNARLLNAAAHALLRLDDIPQLRERIRRRDINDTDATSRFSRPISSLLNMVFEAMDGATDPGITRQLVALLNFMQGKELCGQERAFGVSAFAAGYLDEGQKVTLIGLQQAQERSFTVFSEYAHPETLAHWQRLREDETALHRFRLLAQQSRAEQPLDTNMAHIWFDVTTARIDAIHALETMLANQLSASCAERLSHSNQQQDDQNALMGQFLEQHGNDEHTATVLYSLQGRPLDTTNAEAVSQGMARSLLDLLHAQSQRLQEADQALLSARREQQERRLVEQAKWQLVSRYRITEPEALERMQRIAMNRNMPLYDVARQLLTEMGSAKPARP
jgi:hypothetical protein